MLNKSRLGYGQGSIGMWFDRQTEGFSVKAIPTTVVS